MHKRIGILGYGEVGQSLHRLYCDYSEFTVFIRDLERDDGLRNLDVLNVCIPYNDDFSDAVVGCIRQSTPKLTIIHSTVSPGTTQEISSQCLNDDGHILHSPVRGVHPDLYESFKEFIKFVGAESYEAAQEAVDHLNRLGISAEFIGSSLTSELGKLMSTTYYGLCIAWHGEMHKLCEKFGVEFDQAVTRFNETYNVGYAKLGKLNVVRPVLIPPKGKNASIGGHCIVSNAELLNRMFTSKALELIIEYKKQDKAK
tara:strand:+ start:5203 stop:5970 length:768 start_codon:yes stop_codon:yes gene_type:complete